MWYMDDGQLNKTVCPETNQKPKTTLAPPPPVTQRVRHFQSHNTLHTNSHHLLQTHPQERREPEVTVRSSSSGSGSAHIFPVESIPSGVSECCACDEAKYEVIQTYYYTREDSIYKCFISFDFRLFLKGFGQKKHIRKTSQKMNGFYILAT